MERQAGWLWLIIDVIFVAALGVALVWGTTMPRSRRQRAHTERATKDVYRRGAEDERAARNHRQPVGSPA